MNPQGALAPTRVPAGAVAAATLLLLPVLSCDSGPGVSRLPDLEAESRVARFQIAAQADHPSLLDAELTPSAEAASVEGGSEALGLFVRAKRVAARPELLWLELMIENRSSAGLRDARIHVRNVEGAPHAIDVSNRPFAEEPLAAPIAVGGLGPEGLARVALALPVSAGDVSLEVEVEATTTRFVATHSAPIASTPDGSEVWAVFGDADVVAAIDTASDARVASVPVPGRPASVALTPDGEQVLVASRDGNQVTVIDRVTREPLQSLTEDDGLGRDLRHLVISPDGAHAYVGAYVSDRITRLERRGERWRVRGHLDVGRRPAGMAVSPDSATLFVAHYLPRGPLATNHAWISVVDTGELTIRSEPELHDDFGADRVGCIADVFGVSAQRLTMEGVPTQLAGVFLKPGGQHAAVPGARIVGTPIIEVGENPADSVFARAGLARFLPPFIFRIDTREHEAPEVMRNELLLEPPDINAELIRCGEYGAELEMTNPQYLSEAQEEQYNSGLAFPSGTSGLTESGAFRFFAYGRGGRTFAALSYLADEIAVFDATTFHPASQRHFPLSGSNPTGMVVVNDGTKAYVVYENSTFVSVLSTPELGALREPSYVPYRFDDVNLGANNIVTRQALVRTVRDVPERPSFEEIAQVPLVDADPMPAEERLGRVLFHSSNPDKYPFLTQSRQAACASCHPGGGNDGSAWATMEGERRTMTLYGGVAGRGWLHASGTHRDIYEFVEFIVRERLGGELPEEEHRALAEYVATGIGELQRPEVDEAAAERGRALFEENCSRCHQGERLTSGDPDPANEWGGGAEDGPRTYDVGTGTDAAGVIFGSFFESLFEPVDAELLSVLRGDRDLGEGDRAQELLDFQQRPDRKAGRLKAPALVNLWDEPLYFHDGRFHTLAQVVDYFDGILGLELSDEDKRALVAYLKTL